MLKQWQVATEGMSTDESDSQNLSNRPPSSGLGASFGGGSSFDQLNGGYGVSRNPGFDTLSDKDSVSLHAHSVTASHVEKTMSEVASSLSVPFPRYVF